MIARQDNENLYLIYSDDLYTWDGGQPILKPEFPWEFVQIGNCGSPIELDEGWLLLDARRRPGAEIFDRRGAARQERSHRRCWRARASRWCGPSRPNAKAMCPTSSTPAAPCATAISIILPYAVSDTFSNFATIKIAALLATMK